MSGPHRSRAPGMQRAGRTVLLAFLIGLAGCAISHRDEIRMGQDYARQLNAQLPLVADPEVNRYLALLGDSIARLADERGLDWHFYLVDSKEVNAFALPGGFIYVTRGLIDRTDKLTELAGVLGHEVSHVTRRHTVKQLERAQQADVGVTLICVLTGVCESTAAQVGIQVGGAAIFARYSRDDERQADRDAVPNVVRAGIHPAGIVTLLEKLLEERKRSPDALAAWFSTHPTEEDRIAEARRLIAEIDPVILARLVRDTPRYRAFRERLARLPATRRTATTGMSRSEASR